MLTKIFFYFTERKVKRVYNELMSKRASLSRYKNALIEVGNRGPVAMILFLRMCLNDDFLEHYADIDFEELNK
ncbi:hypothetical protein [Paraburkholderia silvatlantica]|uniref:Uncharacterized protein n=1 Tax=Paraburkholderia silvatlantica TaxID=321895 RepID=A0ABR6FM75_9BURK|nr:hypothetical protein [Paraburkholderia silvatlantica]MBB2928534.1 hypothetical protein [Paraburkholderia silvatlantica]PVY23586.1 hypothetical protein C7411_12872 [Paraburkholderia silvatlantica]PXW30824.1 hypothetical protein C7413_12772 [Paraburkholderia silvatlantica]